MGSADIDGPVRVAPPHQPGQRGPRYLVFRGSDAETAKPYLLEELPPVLENRFSCIAESPDRNWGKDLNGLSTWRLCPLAG